MAVYCVNRNNWNKFMGRIKIIHLQISPQKDNMLRVINKNIISVHSPVISEKIVV